LVLKGFLSFSTNDNSENDTNNNNHHYYQYQEGFYPTNDPSTSPPVDQRRRRDEMVEILGDMACLSETFQREEDLLSLLEKENDKLLSEGQYIPFFKEPIKKN